MQQDSKFNFSRKGKNREGYREVYRTPLCKTWVHGSVLGCTSACCHQIDESMTP